MFQIGADCTAGMLLLPHDRGRHRAIIVIHEWWGLNDWIREQAAHLAANGYLVLAVDLYAGKVTADRSEARKLRRDLPQDRALRDLQAAFDYLIGRADVDPTHISVLGWSMGGALALQLAMREPRLAACVVNYGELPADLGGIRSIHAGVLGNFGALDRLIPPAKVRAFEVCMHALAKSVDFKIYAGAGHAFANPGDKRNYWPQAAADAWSRTLAFLEEAPASDCCVPGHDLPTAPCARERGWS
jgi:carboxymethylenebutenolidase